MGMMYPVSVFHSMLPSVSSWSSLSLPLTVNDPVVETLPWWWRKMSWAWRCIMTLSFPQSPPVKVLMPLKSWTPSSMFSCRIQTSLAVSKWSSDSCQNDTLHGRCQPLGRKTTIQFGVNVTYMKVPVQAYLGYAQQAFVKTHAGVMRHHAARELTYRHAGYHTEVCNINMLAWWTWSRLINVQKYVSNTNCNLADK